MKITITHKLPKTDTTCVLVCKDFAKSQYGSLLSDSLVKAIKTRMEAKDFLAKPKEVLQIFSTEKKDHKFFLIGLGENPSQDEIRKSAAIALKSAKKSKSNQLAFVVPEAIDIDEVVLGAGLGNYTFKVGDTSDEHTIKSLTFVAPEKALEGSGLNSEALVNSICLTRDLVNLPTNLMTPEMLADQAKAIGKGVRNPLKVTVLDQKKIEKLNMGGVLGVSQGAAHGPRVAIFEYYGNKKSKETTALVGKGVCFDSGGYNLKPTSGILTMKMDMAGAATVLGIFDWIAKTKPKKNVIGIIGAVENMISGDAYRPGDIITMMNGQTCKITNTDAEGRLVLADCLHHIVTKYKPTEIIDFATLTGAVITSLGNRITGLVTNNDDLCSAIKESAEEVSEQVWQLPLTDLFREKIKGTEADLKNWTAGVGAGACMAGAFLENFVGGTPWVHCDIAGTAYQDKDSNELHPQGATGSMIMTITNYLDS